jgi:hypothetical protein
VSDNCNPPDAGSLERPFRIFADNRYVGTIDAFSSDDAKERWRTTKIPNAVRRLIIALRAVEVNDAS